MNDREAQKLVDDLFRNGAGQEADRLVLTKDNDRTGHGRSPTSDLGGWCKQAVLDRILAYGEQVRGEQREQDAKVADGWARSPSCLEPHEDNPCCHVRTGAGIADAIRANDQGAKPKGENHAG